VTALVATGASGLPSPDFETLAAIRAGGRRAMSRALSDIESRYDAMAPVLDAALTDQRARTLGLTGPPGAGKSSLLGALIGRWRAAGDSVGVIAVDPSSRRSGGALLGDRLRLHIDGEDAGLFVRSMAARRALGGVADLTLPALVLMAAVYDRVVVETVGVGQSETDVRDLVETVVLCVPPHSGDMVQFMKAGIVEIPDIIAVTKADVGPAAARTAADLRSAMGVGAGDAARDVQVMAVSAQTGAGLDALGRWGRDDRPRVPTMDLAALALAWGHRRRIEAELARLAPGGGPVGAVGPFTQALQSGGTDL